MKNITNAMARAECRRELRRVFKEARIVDGIGDEASEGAFSYWYDKARDGAVGDYVVYEITDSGANTRADDGVLIREVEAQIDVLVRAVSRVNASRNN